MASCSENRLRDAPSERQVHVRRVQDRVGLLAHQVARHDRHRQRPDRRLELHVVALAWRMSFCMGTYEYAIDIDDGSYEY